MAAGPSNPYDEIPYPAAPYPYTHPDHLSVVARLFALEPAPVSSARVLEIGCANGANLIPMGLTLSGARFEGIDRSARQIAAGRETIGQLQLSNIELHHADLAEFVPSADVAYDYIIAHGVLSWTPAAMHDALFGLCRRLLSPQGVALISYNVKAGWQQRSLIREWLLEATADQATAAGRVGAARRLIDELRLALSEADPTRRENRDTARLRDELDRLAAWSDNYLCHDLLEADNEPRSFSDFLHLASRHELRYVADADFASMVAADLPTAVARALARIGKNRLDCEKLFDLVGGRAFRQSIICHADRTLPEQIGTEALKGFYVASPIRRDQNFKHPSIVRFRAPSGFVLDIEEAGLIAAFDYLARRWPIAEPFGQVAAMTRLDTGGPENADPTVDSLAGRLAELLLAGFAERAVELHTIASAYTLDASEYPLASPLARLQADRTTMVTSLRHDLIELNPQERRLLGLLDGRHHRDALPQLAGERQPLEAASTWDATKVDAILKRLATAALLLPAG
jgi:trans-aconitate methyltransferase